MTVKYRKTKTGKWAAFGPTDEVTLGSVTVTKANGDTKTETVVSLGKTFVIDGIDHCYGYLAERATSSYGYRRNSNWAPRSCDWCQDVEDTGDANGCPRHRGNPRN